MDKRTLDEQVAFVLAHTVRGPGSAPYEEVVPVLSSLVREEKGYSALLTATEAALDERYPGFATMSQRERDTLGKAFHFQQTELYPTYGDIPVDRLLIMAVLSPYLREVVRGVLVDILPPPPEPTPRSAPRG